MIDGVLATSSLLACIYEIAKDRWRPIGIYTLPPIQVCMTSV